MFNLLQIKEAERKNNAAAPLSPIELIALGLDAVETGTYVSTARRRMALSWIRIDSFAGTSTEQSRRPCAALLAGPAQQPA